MEDHKARKQMLREEAVRTRGLLSLDNTETKSFIRLFFESIPLTPENIIAAYWPIDREFDLRPLLDELLERGHILTLPVVEKGAKILKFVKWDHNIDLVEGAYGICHPVLNENTQYLVPDTYLVPMLAFDRRGTRLGYGGGYYDATLAEAEKQKNITKIGVAYAQQACLFNLPTEEHDIKMDWIITQQQAISF